MRIFTVHARDIDGGGGAPRTRLVREGFSVWAFLLGPFWLLFRGLWLALLGAVLVAVAIGFLPGNGPEWGLLALHLLLGFHARDLERWTLRRRGYADAGVVAAPDEEIATIRLVAARPALAPGLMA